MPQVIVKKWDETPPRLDPEFKENYCAQGCNTASMEEQLPAECLRAPNEDLPPKAETEPHTAPQPRLRRQPGPSPPTAEGTPPRPGLRRSTQGGVPLLCTDGPFQRQSQLPRWQQREHQERAQAASAEKGPNVKLSPRRLTQSPRGRLSLQS